MAAEARGGRGQGPCAMPAQTGVPRPARTPCWPGPLDSCRRGTLAQASCSPTIRDGRRRRSRAQWAFLASGPQRLNPMGMHGRFGLRTKAGVPWLGRTARTGLSPGSGAISRFSRAWGARGGGAELRQHPLARLCRTTHGLRVRSLRGIALFLFFFWFKQGSRIAPAHGRGGRGLRAYGHVLTTRAINLGASLHSARTICGARCSRPA